MLLDGSAARHREEHAHGPFHTDARSGQYPTHVHRRPHRRRTFRRNHRDEKTATHPDIALSPGDTAPADPVLAHVGLRSFRLIVVSSLPSPSHWRLQTIIHRATPVARLFMAGETFAHPACSAGISVFRGSEFRGS